MRRRVFILAIFLLAGAVVNVAVAWGCAAWSPFPMQSGLSVASQWPGQVPEDWAPPIESVGSGFGTTATLFTSGNWKGPHVQVYAAGWPLRALSAMTRIMVGHSSGPRPGIPLVPVGKNRGLGVLPLRPIWPGFAVNTLLYAVVLWRTRAVMGQPPSTTRHRLRGSLCAGVWMASRFPVARLRWQSPVHPPAHARSPSHVSPPGRSVPASSPDKPHLARLRRQHDSIRRRPLAAERWAVRNAAVGAGAAGVVSEVCVSGW